MNTVFHAFRAGVNWRGALKRENVLNREVWLLNQKHFTKRLILSIFHRIKTQHVFILQHYLTMFGATVGLPFALAIPLCLGSNFTIIGEIISTMFFCSGLVTLLQTTFGVRYVKLHIVFILLFYSVKPGLVFCDLHLI